MSITAQYQKYIAEAAQEALRSLLADNPSTSVVDLRELVAEYPALGEATLTDLLGGATKAPRRGRPAKSEGAKAAAPAGDKKTAKRSPKAKGEWETHTADGRAALDRAVLESLAAFGGVSVSAEALRARLGATPAQLRSSLNRHIERGDVSFTGKARGTRYSLEG
ncbi:MAG: hypothetical protein R6X02_02280 [Enhygromyxa sp.]